MAKIGTRHASGAKKFDNGWFIEREVTRGGRTYRQWFRTRDPNAQPSTRVRAPRAARAAPASSAEPRTRLQKFADKVGLSDSAKRSLASLPDSLRRDAKADLLTMHRTWGRARKPEVIAERSSRLPRGRGDDSAPVTSTNIVAKMKTLGVRVDGGEHAGDALKTLFPGKTVTVGDLKNMMGLDAFRKHTSSVTGQPTLSFGATNVTYKAIFAKDGQRADIARKIAIDPETKKPYAYHDHFFVDQGLQGGGLGREVLKSQLTTYKKLGVPEVHVYAVEIGKYYWRKIGFERQESKDLQQDKQVFRDWLVRRKNTPEATADRIVEQVKTSRQLATLEVAGQKFGKEFTTSGASTGGEFRLNLNGAGWGHVKEEFGVTD
jgi:hypothetical protein